VLFAAFFGDNPVKQLPGPTLSSIPPARQATVTGHVFFTGLISGPFHHGLAIVFTFATIMCLAAAGASWLRGAWSVPPPTISRVESCALRRAAFANGPGSIDGPGSGALPRGFLA
jgi:hypothetical protein